MNGILYLSPCSYFESLSVSKNIHQDMESLCDGLCDLISSLSSMPRVKLIATSDWYQLNDGNDLYNLVQSNLDPSVQMSLFMRMDCITSIASQSVDKNLATINIGKKCDQDFYYGFFSDQSDCCETVNAYQYVNSLETLFEFHVHFLKHCPKSNLSYGERCIDIFTNLEFYDGFSKDLKSLGSGVISGIVHFSIPMTSCLKALNDYGLINRNMRDVTRELQANTGINCCEEGGTGGKKSGVLDADLQEGYGIQQTVNCEYHFKPVHSNNDSVKWHGKNRMYFGLMPDDHDKKFYIHRIGHW